MSYKVKHEKSNLVFMTSVIILCLVTCAFWLVLREYIYFSVYLILTLMIIHIYYFTKYFLSKDALIVKLGFLKIKIKYKSIKKIDNLQNSVKLKLGSVSFNIYPNNKDIFFAELCNKWRED